MKAISKVEFKHIEKVYNRWLKKHPRGDQNYKAFSHMRRTVEFARYYAAHRNLQLVHLKTENQWLPIGSTLTSKENGELILAPPDTPKELIVGVVSENGTVESITPEQ